MNTFPKVSVVTTTYNDIENLKRILAEVKKQTYPNIEHIIVDGGSTDGTVELLKELEEKEPGRISWMSEKDNGIYDADLVSEKRGLRQVRSVPDRLPDFRGL